ncbi:MAG TPA: hypothetical protein DHU85_06615 [Porphyromonadaceae bacterium]|nr:hypothetical protein [Porphyromonadaceae bacterium]
MPLDKGNLFTKQSINFCKPFNTISVAPMRATLFFYPIIIGTVSIFKKAGNALRTLPATCLL